MRTYRTINKSYVTTLFAVIALMSVSACSPKRIFVKEFAEVVAAGVDTYEQESDLQFLEKAFPANIKMMETLLVSAPDDVTMLQLLARSYAGYALLFEEYNLEQQKLSVVSGKWEARDSETVPERSDRIARYYERGAKYALKSLAVRHPGAGEQLAKLATIDIFLNSMKTDDVPALFWYGFNLGSWVNHRTNSVRSISKAHISEKVMKRILELSPEFYNGGAHLFLLSYYGSRPAMMGGDIQAAKTHYKALKEIAGDDFFMADFYYAKFVLLQMQERQAFEQTLERVISGAQRESAHPLYNKAAARRARIYLDAAERLFD